MSLREMYLQNSNIPARYLKDIKINPSVKDAEAFTVLRSIHSNIVKFADDGECLMICSNNCGNGKTTIATKLLKAFIDKSDKMYSSGTPVLFVNVPNFMNEIKLSISDKSLSEHVQSIERDIMLAKIVVFDDIGDKSLSEFDSNLLYYWIDTRTANMKSCIYTSNQLPNELKNTLNGKLFSRVINYSTIITLTDGDHRGDMK